LVQTVNNFILAKIGKRNMKKSFQKTLIAASVGAVMLAAAGTASANSLLFPYFTTVAGAQSILSITADGTTAAGISGSAFSVPGAGERLHYVYNYGDACTHYDGSGFVTRNDVMQHSLADPTYGGIGKVQSTDQSVPFYLPLQTAKGFLTVSNMTSTGSINGDLSIIDPATGLVVSYPGISNGLNTTVAANEGNFAAIVDNNFELSHYPANLVTTSFYAAVVGNMNSAIAAGRDWVGQTTLSNGGNIWSNDESGRSGTKTKVITCGGSFTANDLRTEAQNNWIANNAGLIRVTATPTDPLVDTTTETSTGLVVVKLQAVQAAVGAPYAGKTFFHRVPAANVSNLVAPL
jgi:hypothetical protein